ncbi:hypothetical protein EVAR_36064_1 [Eumeta japonica]|uniref:Uncharacterized protein n=1 Tax=Eumeta variegata TaxID=151549 RepID=A0A4C1ZBE9_EUMVA|nr:hypothetical protein EVAR_36064_1 [Eumeta japonica]
MRQALIPCHLKGNIQRWRSQNGLIFTHYYESNGLQTGGPVAFCRRTPVPALCCRAVAGPAGAGALSFGSCIHYEANIRRHVPFLYLHSIVAASRGNRINIHTTRDPESRANNRGKRAGEPPEYVIVVARGQSQFQRSHHCIADLLGRHGISNE